MRETSASVRPGIIIPFHFGGDFIEETIEALQRQSLAEWSAVIVVDGATEAESRQLDALAAGEERLFLIRTAGNTGPAHARNVGAMSLSSDRDVLVFLDCDDVLRSGALTTLCRLLDEFPDAPVAYGVSEYLGDAPATHRPNDIADWARSRLRVGRGGELEPVPLSARTDFAALAVSNWIATPGQAVVRRAAFEQVGGFSEAVPRAVEDWDLWLRLAARQPFVFTDAVVLEWRQHGASLSNDGSIMQSKEEQYRRSLARSDQLTEAQRRQVFHARRAEWRRRRDSKLRYAADALRDHRIADAGRELARAAKANVEVLRR